MKPPVLKPREVERVLLKNGFEIDRQTGSHRVYYSTESRLIVVVPFHNKALPLGTMRSIIKQSGLSLTNFQTGKKS